MLDHYVPLRVVGFYKPGYNLGMACWFLVTSINQAYQPYLLWPHEFDAAGAEGKILKNCLFLHRGPGAYTLAGSLVRR